MICHHYCNNPLACPECVKRFWKWAESWAQVAYVLCGRRA